MTDRELIDSARKWLRTKSTDPHLLVEFLADALEKHQPVFVPNCLGSNVVQSGERNPLTVFDEVADITPVEWDFLCEAMSREANKGD